MYSKQSVLHEFVFYFMRYAIIRFVYIWQRNIVMGTVCIADSKYTQYRCLYVLVPSIVKRKWHWCKWYTPMGNCVICECTLTDFSRILPIPTISMKMTINTKKNLNTACDYQPLNWHVVGVLWQIKRSEDEVNWCYDFLNACWYWTMYKMLCESS